MPRLIDVDNLAEYKFASDRIIPTEWQQGWNDALDTVINEVPTVDAVEVVRCKDCKYFLYDKLYMVEGLPLMGNHVCEKWGNGCRTDENGYCFMGERKEDAE